MKIPVYLRCPREALGTLVGMHDALPHELQQGYATVLLSRQQDDTRLFSESSADSQFALRAELIFEHQGHAVLAYQRVRPDEFPAIKQMWAWREEHQALNRYISRETARKRHADFLESLK